MKGIKDIIVKGSIFAVLTAVFCMGGIPAAPLVSTAYAEVTWSGDKDFTVDTEIDDIVSLTTNITLTVADGKTLTINGSIDCDNNTLTFAGPGTVTVSGEYGENGIKGNVTITGGTLTAYGGTVYRDDGHGIKGNVKLTGGTLNATGGAAAGTIYSSYS